MKRKNFTPLFLVAAMMLLGTQTSKAEVPNPPESLPVAPTHSAADVTSIYSGAYTNVTTISGFSGIGDVKEVRQVLGDEMIYIENGLNEWSTVELASTVDINTNKVLFMDVYVVSGELNMKISFSDESSTFPIKLIEGWNKLEIDLNDYRILTSAPDLTKIAKISFVNDGGYPRTIFVDNIYACNAVPTDLLSAPTVAAPNTTVVEPTSVLPIFTDLYSNEVGATLLPNTPGDVLKMKGLPIDGSTALDRMFWIKNGINNGSGGYLFANEVDASKYDYVHLDIFLDGTEFPIRFRFGINTETFTGSIAPNPATALYTAIPGWNSVNLSLEQFVALSAGFDLTKMNGFGFFNQKGYKRNVYVDNLYFYKHTTMTDIDALASKVQIATFPNPVTNQLVVESATGMLSVDVFSITGQRIQTVNGMGNRFHVNMTSNASGIYMVQVKLENGETVTHRIVKK